MGSEQLILYCVKGDTLPYFFLILKKTFAFSEKYKITTVYGRKKDENGAYRLERNLITFYHIKLPSFKF